MSPLINYLNLNILFVLVSRKSVLHCHMINRPHLIQQFIGKLSHLLSAV